MPITLQTFAAGDIDYIAKMNSNNSAIQNLVNTLETSKLDASAKGAVDGVAALGADGLVPPSQLPDMSGYEVRTNKAVANGYAGLDATGKVPYAQLPAALLATPPSSVDLTPYQMKAEKGAVNGYAGLDSGAKVPVAQLPDLAGTYQVASAKGNANGYAGLDANGKVPSTQLPDLAAQLFIVNAFVGGVPGNNAVLLAVLPTTACSFVANFTGSRAKAGVAATAQTVLSIKKNGTAVGTITFAASGTTGTFAAASPVSLTTADELTVECPASMDITLADIRFALHGTR